ncbi:MAG TPA: hypothetical protein ENK82_06685 [Campylobacterales bacterium]|nr:hypothetical protein [Campylobacterales bacterium]HHS93016.1 hypothetical protein [Campylobacterales bacterium]
MSNITALEALNAKISILLEKYDALKEENRLLKDSLRSSRETETRLRQEIVKLKEEDELKNMELEDIVSRISESMGIELEQANMVQEKLKQKAF